MSCSRINVADLSQQADTATLAEHQQALYVMLCELDRICEELNISYFLFAGTLLGAVRHKGFIPWDDDLDIIMKRKDYDRFLREAPNILDCRNFCVQAEFSEHWPMFFSKMRLNGSTCLEKYFPKNPSVHQGVYIDIFPCDNAFATRFGEAVQFLCSKVIIADSLYRRGYITDSILKKIFMLVCRIIPKSPMHRIVRGPKKNAAAVHSFLGGSSKFSKSIYPAECFEKAERISFEDGSFPVPEKYDTLLKILYGDYMKIPSEEERRCKEHAILVDLKRPYVYYKDYRNGMRFETHTRSIR